MPPSQDPVQKDTARMNTPDARNAMGISQLEVPYYQVSISALDSSIHLLIEELPEIAVHLAAPGLIDCLEVDREFIEVLGGVRAATYINIFEGVHSDDWHAQLQSALIRVGMNCTRLLRITGENGTYKDLIIIYNQYILDTLRVNYPLITPQDLLMFERSSSGTEDLRSIRLSLKERLAESKIIERLQDHPRVIRSKAAWLKALSEAAARISK